MTQRGKAYNIAIIGILGALIILQAYIPMVGYVQIFPAWPAISTIHLTVIIGGIVLGYGGGASLGLLWGLTSLIRAYTSATDPVTLLLFRNPIIAIVPRVMVGLVAAFIFHQLFKNTNFGSCIITIQTEISVKCCAERLSEAKQKQHTNDHKWRPYLDRRRTSR